MTPKASVQYLREGIEVTLWGDMRHSFEISIGDVLWQIPGTEAQNCTTFIPYEKIYLASEFPIKILSIELNKKSKIEAVEHSEALEIFKPLDFFGKIQDPSKRSIHDAEAIRFVCRRMIMRHEIPVSTKLAALCVLGYRIIEEGDQLDSDIAFVLERYENLLESDGNDRWISSVCTMLIYLGIMLSNTQMSRNALEKVQSSKSFERIRSPNFAISRLLLALQLFLEGSKNDAAEILRDSECIFRNSISDSACVLSNPLVSYFPYTEVFATLSVIRRISIFRQLISLGQSRDESIQLIEALKISSINPSLRNLIERGYFAKWVETARSTRTLSSPFLATSSVSPTDTMSSQLEELLLLSIREEAELDLESAKAKLTEIANSCVMTPQVIQWKTCESIAKSHLLLGYLMRHHKLEKNATEIFNTSICWAPDILRRQPYESLSDFESALTFCKVIMACQLSENRAFNPAPAYSEYKKLDESLMNYIKATFGNDVKILLFVDGVLRSAKQPSV